MTKEQFRNDIIAAMSNVMDSTQIAVLNSVLVNRLKMVEFEESQLPATYEDNNEYILNLFYKIKGSKVSEKTMKFYRFTLTRFIEIVQKPLLKVSGLDIEYFLEILSKTNSEVSLNNHRRNLSAFYTWLRKRRFITANPCDDVEAYTEVKKPIDHLEVEEMEILKNGCKTTRQRALIEFLRCTGLRVGELIAVKISDVDFISGKVLAFATKTKEWRETWLDKIALGYLRKYLFERGVSESSEEPLFISLKRKRALSASGVNCILKKIKSNAHMDRRVYTHLIRKSVATTIVKRGGSVVEAGDYLGHKDNTVTGQHYAYKGADHKKRIFDNYVAAV